MAEMKWRRIEDVPDEDWERGWGFQYGNGTYGVTKNRLVTECHAKHGMVKGPLDLGEPPQPPPSIYRFEATCDGKRVSGIYVPGEPNNPRLCRVFFSEGHYGSYHLDCLTEIDWLDQPPEDVL